MKTKSDYLNPGKIIECFGRKGIIRYEKDFYFGIYFFDKGKLEEVHHMNVWPSDAEPLDTVLNVSQ